MTRADVAIQDALNVVAKSRDLRERAEARRRELQRKTEFMTAKPIYILKKNGGRQLSLKLDS
ncbi:hypothetical protein G6L28_07640 [Agrobacterium larrymoorei]|uniref:hypothetical protein n=1 Tax=Agrobacterium larrymoorei TaxID=160699 RepID=UPI0015745825|nr:hypothetical protein [Agrobacterium larrymoorei]NTJ42471.1 hypothetical protein [Agrobacterium larrymoorei]